jgi:hypothetical protein
MPPLNTFRSVTRNTILIWSVGLVALVEPAFAQGPENVPEWQRIIAGQQQQLETQQKQLNAQNEMLRQLQWQMQSLAAPGAGAVGQPTVQPPPEAGAALSQDFKHERVYPTSSNFTFPAAALNLRMPGIKTQVGIHGFTEGQTIFDITNGLNNNEFDTSFIPIPSEPSQTKFSVNPSKFAISTATPVPSGRLNTMVTVDFNGQLDAPVPRLRVTYGEFINDDLNFALLAGQTFTTMVDLKAQPETLDFAGPTGLFARRQPVAKFSKLFGREILTELAMETPEGSIFIDAMPLSKVPAFVGAVNWLPNGDRIRNLRLAGLARALNAEGPDGSQYSAFGWAVVGSGRVMLPLFCEKNNLAFNVQFGDGYGGQLKSGPADAVLNLATSELTTLPVFSTYGGLQLWWTDSLRTNLVCGYNSVDNPGFIDGGALKSTLYTAVNLVWNPIDKVTVGIEYLYGNRKNEDGVSGEANRILLSSRFVY